MLEWKLEKVIEQASETREALPEGRRARGGSSISLGADNLRQRAGPMLQIVMCWA